MVSILIGSNLHDRYTCISFILLDLDCYNNLEFMFSCEPTTVQNFNKIGAG